MVAIRDIIIDIKRTRGAFIEFLLHDLIRCCHTSSIFPFFPDIGGFDTTLFPWGQESIELSIRVWLCGTCVY